MLKRKRKKAQFYLMATIIIIGIVMSILTITNYSFKRDYRNIYDFQEELRIEGEKVMDYETVNPSSHVFDDFAKKYSKYIEGQKEIYFIVGERGDLDVFKYTGEDKEDCNDQVTMDVNTLIFELDNHNYEFEIKEGQNLHFIIIEKVDGEKYVVTS